MKNNWVLVDEVGIKVLENISKKMSNISIKFLDKVVFFSLIDNFIRSNRLLKHTTHSKKRVDNISDCMEKYINLRQMFEFLYAIVCV